MRGIFTSLAITLGLLAPATQALASGIVYLGSDPTAHYTSFPQGLTLVQNAVTFAGGQSNPTMLLVGSGTGFGNTPSMLTAAGLSYNQIAPINLASTILGSYQVVYFAPTTASAEVAFYTAAAAQVLSYTNGGGGLVVEPEVFATGSWGWVPYANLIGHSGATNVTVETVVLINNPPLSNSLTSFGLSNWGSSNHSTFSTPGAAGFTTLSTVNNGIAQVIFRANANAAVPEPATLAVFGGIALAGAFGYRRRKATASV